MDIKYCKCGCGKEIEWKYWHDWEGRQPRYIQGHGRGKFISEEIKQQSKVIKICECGCEQEIPWMSHHFRHPPRFIKYHFKVPSGWKHTEEWKKERGKQSKGNTYALGFKQSEETKRKRSLSLTGKKRQPFTEEHKKNMSLVRMGKHFSPLTQFKKGITPWVDGKKMDIKSYPNFGMRNKKHSKESIEQMKESHKGFIITEEQKQKLRMVMKGKNLAEKNGQWLGGKSFEPYTYDFNKRFKELIKQRDCYVCQMCNLIQNDAIKLYKKGLAIHHIDYNKLNSFPENCISLCIRCHMLTNYNRDSWKIFFQNLLKEKYGYEYTQDQKIILEFVQEDKNVI